MSSDMDRLLSVDFCAEIFTAENRVALKGTINENDNEKHRISKEDETEIKELLKGEDGSAELIT